VYDQDGKTALHRAVEKGQTDIITLLLDRGANINIYDQVNYTILSLHNTVEKRRSIIMK
jgi:ankyrin repeat protein